MFRAFTEKLRGSRSSPSRNNNNKTNSSSPTRKSKNNNYDNNKVGKSKQNHHTAAIYNSKQHQQRYLPDVFDLPIVNTIVDDDDDDNISELFSDNDEQTHDYYRAQVLNNRHSSSNSSISNRSRKSSKSYKKSSDNKSMKSDGSIGGISFTSFKSARSFRSAKTVDSQKTTQSTMSGFRRFRSNNNKKHNKEQQQTSCSSTENHHHHHCPTLFVEILPPDFATAPHLDDIIDAFSRRTHSDTRDKVLVPTTADDIDDNSSSSYYSGFDSESNSSTDDNRSNMYGTSLYSNSSSNNKKTKKKDRKLLSSSGNKSVTSIQERSVLSLQNNNNDNYHTKKKKKKKSLQNKLNKKSSAGSVKTAPDEFRRVGKKKKNNKKSSTRRDDDSTSVDARSIISSSSLLGRGLRKLACRVGGGGGGSSSHHDNPAAVAAAEITEHTADSNSSILTSNTTTLGIEKPVINNNNNKSHHRNNRSSSASVTSYYSDRSIQSRLSSSVRKISPEVVKAQKPINIPEAARKVSRSTHENSKIAEMDNNNNNSKNHHHHHHLYSSRSVGASGGGNNNGGGSGMQTTSNTSLTNSVFHKEMHHSAAVDLYRKASPSKSRTTMKSSSSYSSLGRHNKLSPKSKKSVSSPKSQYSIRGYDCDTGGAATQETISMSSMIENSRLARALTKTAKTLQDRDVPDFEPRLEDPDKPLLDETGKDCRPGPDNPSGSPIIDPLDIELFLTLGENEDEKFDDNNFDDTVSALSFGSSLTLTSAPCVVGRRDDYFVHTKRTEYNNNLDASSTATMVGTSLQPMKTTSSLHDYDRIGRKDAFVKSDTKLPERSLADEKVMLKKLLAQTSSEKKLDVPNIQSIAAPAAPVVSHSASYAIPTNMRVQSNPRSVAILLVDPVHKIFEIVSIGTPRGTTVGAALSKAKDAAADKILSAQTYLSLCNDVMEATNLDLPVSKLAPRKTQLACPNYGDDEEMKREMERRLLVAVPQKSTAVECQRIRRMLWKNPKLQAWWIASNQSLAKTNVTAQPTN